VGKGNPNLMIIGLLIFALQLIGFVSNAAGGWIITTVDNDSNIINSVSMAIDSNNKVHIAYGNLEGVKYATNASGSWVNTLVDAVVVGDLDCRKWCSYCPVPNASLHFITLAKIVSASFVHMNFLGFSLCFSI
jgi:hypothetical protein